MEISCRENNCVQGSRVGCKVAVTTCHRALYSFWSNFTVLPCSFFTPALWGGQDAYFTDERTEAPGIQSERHRPTRMVPSRSLGSNLWTWMWALPTNPLTALVGTISNGRWPGKGKPIFAQLERGKTDPILLWHLTRPFYPKLFTSFMLHNHTHTHRIDTKAEICKKYLTVFGGAPKLGTT